MTKYIIDEYTEVYTDKIKNELVFYSYQSGKYKIYELDNALVYLISLIQSPRTKKEIYSLLLVKFPNVKHGEFLNAFNALLSDNIIKKLIKEKDISNLRWFKQEMFFS
ncbi:hypothetical protein EFQ26_07790 [Lactobacillus helveticus]|nr:hypothetical protein [Lactobacillus helveticus]MCT3434074.1 hypothetical protein [Lactobacillus helveticus]